MPSTNPQDVSKSMQHILYQPSKSNDMIKIVKYTLKQYC